MWFERQDLLEEGPLLWIQVRKTSMVKAWLGFPGELDILKAFCKGWVDEWHPTTPYNKHMFMKNPFCTQNHF